MLRFLALLLLAVSTPPAQSPVEDSRRPPLFVLEDDDSRVYLLGSIHVLPKGMLPMPRAVEAAYAAADVVAFEANLDSLERLAPAIMRAATDEATVADVLSDGQMRRVEAYAEALGLPAGVMNMFEPWMASMTLSVMALQQAGFDGGGVDAYFNTRARTDGKERVALESGMSQIGFIDDLPLADQVALLESGLAGGPDSTVATVREMLALWSEGQDDALADLMARSMEGSVNLNDAMLTRRNAAWVPQIEALLAREGENALVVVGAGHLVGEGSAVEMLRGRGYAVTRL
jgi:uncharacterized protein YbaP (TraB family)